MARARRPHADRAPIATPSAKRWPKPPSELVRFVRALAIDDARRDHDVALAAARRPLPDGSDFPSNDRSSGRR